MRAMNHRSGIYTAALNHLKLVAMVKLVATVKATLHTYSIYRRTPRDHTSVTMETGSPVRISGATCERVQYAIVINEHTGIQLGFFSTFIFNTGVDLLHEHVTVNLHGSLHVDQLHLWYR